MAGIISNDHVMFMFLIVLMAIAGPLQAQTIAKQKLIQELPQGSQTITEMVMQGQIAGIDVEHMILGGPITHTEVMHKKMDTILLFFKGVGELAAGDQQFKIKPESIAVPMIEKCLNINVNEGDTLHFIRIRKPQSSEDLVNMKGFDSNNRTQIYFRNFEDCTPYTEKIKSPKTVSRTVLPKDHVARVAMGTVKTYGPDAVGAHEHPMLEQLFLGLEGNDITFYADDEKIAFGEFEILHVPLGSSHWVDVADGRDMYYQWMDFFMTQKGEEWLKTHKHVDDDENDVQ